MGKTVTAITDYSKILQTELARILAGSAIAIPDAALKVYARVGHLIVDPDVGAFFRRLQSGTTGGIEGIEQAWAIACQIDAARFGVWYIKALDDFDKSRGTWEDFVESLGAKIASQAVLQNGLAELGRYIWHVEAKYGYR